MPIEKDSDQNHHFCLLWTVSGDAKKPLAIPYEKLLHSLKIDRSGFVGAKRQASWSRNNFVRSF